MIRSKLDTVAELVYHHLVKKQGNKCNWDDSVAINLLWLHLTTSGRIASKPPRRPLVVSQEFLSAFDDILWWVLTLDPATLNYYIVLLNE